MILLLHNILEFENSLYLCNGSSDHDEILHERVDWGRKQCGKLKLAYVRNSRWRTAAILKIVNLQYLRNRSSDHDEIFHQYADCGCKNAERLKFAYFKYSKWRTAAIVGIENLQSVTVQPIGMKFCRHADCKYKTCG